MRSLRNFIKRVFSNRTAQFFVGAQWLLLILTVVVRYNKMGTLSDFDGHILNEPILVGIFTVINLPALFLMSIVFSLLIGVVWGISLIIPKQLLDGSSLNTIPEHGEEYAAIVFLIIFLVCLSLQWALIGYGVDKSIKFFQPKAK